ncbi:MAG: hypothetical protein K5653_07370 [Clostridiales bacterium]|nr:hypothetical protein [Clostridiales bacterium]
MTKYIYLSFLSWIKEIEADKRKKVYSIINDINDPVFIYKSDENGRLHALEKGNELGDLIDVLRTEIIPYIAYLQAEIEDVWNNNFSKENGLV